MNFSQNRITLSFIGTFVFLIILSGCKKDEDDDPGSNTPAPKEFFTVNYMGDTQSEGIITKNIAVQEGETGIEFSIAFSETFGAEIDMLPILDEGTYACSLSRGFAVSKGTEAWFSSSSTSITIEKHNHETKYVKATVSGTMTNLFQTDHTDNISASFGFYYN